MTYQKIGFCFFYLGITLLFLLSTHALSNPKHCFFDRFVSEIQSNFYLFKNGSSLQKGKKRYPYGAKIRKDQHLMIGFESEYVLSEADLLLQKLYVPDPKFKDASKKWKNWTHDERVEWLQKEGIKSIDDKTEIQTTHLVKRTDVDVPSWMPESLIIDQTGNIEIVLPPFDTLEEFLLATQWISKEVGIGSMQAMISLPVDSFFGVNGSLVESRIGFLNFMHEFDTAEKLTLTAERGKVSKTLEHPWLSPMDAKKQKHLIEFLMKNSKGENYSPELLHRVRTAIDSFKYIGSTAYRPDVVPGTRVAFEIRDAHKNYDVLVKRVFRMFYYLETNHGDFSPLQRVISHDRDSAFKKFSKETQDVLGEIFPDYVNDAPSENFLGQLIENDRIEISKAFSYPLRDWQSVFEGVHYSQGLVYVKQAQENYVKKIVQITKAYKSGSLSKEEAKLKVHQALGEFVLDSNLFKTLSRFESNGVVSDRSLSKYYLASYSEGTPLLHAYPFQVDQARLNLRVANFRNLNKKNVEVVKGVNFKPSLLWREFQGWTGQKDVVVISTYGLDSNEISNLTEQYLQAMGSLTVSFPAKEKSAHLRVRLGKNIYDFDSKTDLETIEFFKGSVSESSYNLSNNRRLEPVLLLLPDEELRLRYYVQQALKDPDLTLGDFHYLGVPSAMTEKMMKSNRPICSSEGHNCVSWISLAPIGKNKESLLDLLQNNRTGSTVMGDYYSGNDTWPAYLITQVDQRRVPYVVFFTPQKLSDAIQEIRELGHLEWDFTSDYLKKLYQDEGFNK